MTDKTLTENLDAVILVCKDRGYSEYSVNLTFLQDLAAYIEDLETKEHLQLTMYADELEINAGLNGRITELEAENRWIPVSERLPEKDGKYLATNPDATTFLYFESGRWILDNDGLACVVNPTHWRPLPSAPEAE